MNKRSHILKKKKIHFCFPESKIQQTIFHENKQAVAQKRRDSTKKQIREWKKKKKKKSAFASTSTRTKGAQFGVFQSIRGFCEQWFFTFLERKEWRSARWLTTEAYSEPTDGFHVDIVVSLDGSELGAVGRLDKSAWGVGPQKWRLPIWWEQRAGPTWRCVPFGRFCTRRFFLNLLCLICCGYQILIITFYLPNIRITRQLQLGLWALNHHR